jgi:hypothetical protein
VGIGILRIAGLTSGQFGLQVIDDRLHLFDEFLSVQDSRAIGERGGFETHSGMETVIGKERR